MIRLSPDAVLDLERLRTFLDENNPDAAQHALGAVDSWDSQISRTVIQGCFLGGSHGRPGSAHLER
jgi:hypothetical protein